MAALTVPLDLVKAGGSNITTSYCLPSLDHVPRTSNALWHSNFTISCKLLSSAFLVAQSTACWETSIPSTDFAPAIPAFKAKDPVWVKQSKTSLPLQILCIAALFSFWSKKNPVFCPFSISTMYLTPFSIISTSVLKGSVKKPFLCSKPSISLVFISLLSYTPLALYSSTSI